MAGSEGIQLANPNTTAAGLPVAAGTTFDCAGGLYVFSVASSAFNAATCALQTLLPDGATYITPLTITGAACSATANAMLNVYLAAGQVRLTVSGGTPTALYASLSRVVS